MLAAILMLSLFGAPQAPAPGPAPTPAEAAALANGGRFEEALEAFRRIAAANPLDHETRLWIARLHGWMGHLDLAAPVYRSVLLEDPGNLQAMLGLGSTLIELGEIEEGTDLLERAEAAQPQNADVLAALGRAHAAAGRSTRALLYAERSVGLAPTVVNLQALERARLAHGHRVEISSFGERYNTAAEDTGSMDLRVNIRLSEQLRVTARGQHQRKFGTSEQRGGAGFEWQWRPRTALLAQVLVGAEGNAVLPRVDVAGDIVHTQGPTEWVAGYRFFDFPSAQVSVVSPGFTWWPTDRSSLSARYYHARTAFQTLRGVEIGHSVSLRAARRVAPRVWLNAGYARGIESFDTLSPDRVGDFGANAVSGGARLDLPSLTSVLGLYEHQWRPGSIRMHRVSISLLQRF